MTAPLREQFKNNGSTTLNGAINNSVTSITVTDGSVFPSTGNFRVIVESEIMEVTARSTNTLTVVRGQEGTAAASHADLLPISHILTADGLDRWGKDSVPLFGYASSPPLNRLVADDGTTLLTVSDFSWINQGSATAVDQAGTIVLTAPAASGENNRILTKAAPGSTPYSYIGAFRFCGFRSDDATSVPHFGMGLRQSSSGKHTVISMLTDGNGPCRMHVGNYTSATSFNGAVVTRAHFGFIAPELWFKVENDGTLINFYVGFDGLTWVQIYSISKTNWMTVTGPDEVMFYCAHAASSGKWPTTARLVHWSRAS